MYGQHQEEGDEDFYKRLSLSASRGVWSSYQTKERQHSTGYYERNKLKNSNNDSFKNQRKQFMPMTPKQPRIRNVRQNEVITNLKSELQNIKSQVAKLIKKQDNDEKTSVVGSVRSPKNIKTPNRHDNFQDNSSSSSFSVRHQNKTRFSTQYNTKQKYLQLQTQSLRNQLKNLKTKYLMRKSQYKEQVSTYQKKIDLLQNVITQGQQQMTQYKIYIEKQIQTIRNNMPMKQGSQNTQWLQKQCQQLKDQITYLKKRTIQANEQIKAMAIQNNQLSNQLRHNSNVNDQTQNIKLQFYNIIIQKDNLIQQKQNQILEMISKQDIAHEIVKKNTELIHTLNRQRQNYQQMQHAFNQKINGLLIIQEQQNNNHVEKLKYQDLLNEYHLVVSQLQQSNVEKQNMNRDLIQLGALITDLKLKNSELENRSNNNVYKSRCQELECQLQEFNVNVMEMVRETAQKINYLESQNQTLKMNQRDGNSQDLISQIQFLKNENQRILTLIAEQKYKFEDKINQCCKLQQTISDLQQQIKNSTFSSQIQNKHISSQQKIMHLQHQLLQKQQQITSLKSDNSAFSNLFSSKCQQFQLLEISYSSKLSQSVSKQSLLQESIKTLSSKLKQYQQVYTKTLRQTKELLTNNVLIDNNIDQSLKLQMDSITKLRATISNKNEQIHMLQQSSFALGNVVNKLKQELQHQRNKLLVSVNTRQQDFQNKKYEQTIKCLEKKINILLIEIQKKEEFIKNYLNANDIQKEQFITKFEELYDSKKLGILNGQLKGEIQKIEHLKEQNSVLMKQLSKVHNERNMEKQQFNSQGVSVPDLQ